jgi:hypothetical protein
MYCSINLRNLTILGGIMLKAALRVTILLLLAIYDLATTVPAWSTEYNLTTAGSTATDSSVIFNQINPQATGTGLIDSFAQIGQPGGSLTFTQAYNTTVNNVLNNGASDQFNHALSLSSVPTVTVSGTVYREFVLDINETGSNPLVSVSDIQVFLTNTGNQSVTGFDSKGQLNLANSTLIYRLDGNGTPGQDDSIKMNYLLNNGSGSGDMIMLIPNALFTGAYDQVVLYSSFGKPYPQDDGFEEWFVCRNKTTGGPQACTGSTSGTNVSGSLSQSVPEPASMLLFGLGLVVGARRLSHQRRKN